MNPEPPDYDPDDTEAQRIAEQYADAAAEWLRCICGPDATGEAPDCRYDCPQHGVTVPYDPASSDIGEDPF